MRHGKGYAVSGNVDADAKSAFEGFLAEVGRRSDAKAPVVLNCRDLKNFSTSAVHLWLAFKRDLVAQVGSVILEECSTSFMDFANVYGETLEGLAVHSAFVPIECVGCARHAELLVDTSAGVPKLGPLLPRCTQCHEPMAEAVDREDYFACLL